jgi:hypothetical protein
VEGAVQGVRRLDRIERMACRRVFEERFTSSRMASDYEAIYKRLISAGAEKLALFVEDK